LVHGHLITMEKTINIKYEIVPNLKDILEKYNSENHVLNVTVIMKKRNDFDHGLQDISIKIESENESAIKDFIHEISLL